MLTQDLAICIRVVDYSETSQIVTFFTRSAGKITAIAKGSKRPKSAFDGPIEIFAHGEIVFSDSNKDKLATLTEFEQKPAFAHLSTNLFALNCSLLAVELLNNLTTDYDPHPQLFEKLLQFLQNVSKSSATGPVRNVAVQRDDAGQKAKTSKAASAEHRDILALLILYQVALLKEVGLIPVLNACTNCKSSFSIGWPESYFSSSANGLICRDCEASFHDKIKLTKTAANCLSDLKYIADADNKALNEIERVLIHHFTDLLHHRPKMAKYIVRN